MVAGYGDETSPKFDSMEADCLDLTKFFFGNEVAVGALTFLQCVGLFICSKKSKHLREIEGEDDTADKRVAYYKQQLEQKRIQSLGLTPKQNTKSCDDRWQNSFTPESMDFIQTSFLLNQDRRFNLI